MSRLFRIAWFFALGLALTVLVLGAVAGDLAVLVGTAPGLGPVGLALFALGVPLTLALAVVAHEAGHLGAGAALGLGPRFAHVGPVTIRRSAGRWRLGWDVRQSWVGGRVVCDRAGCRWRMGVFLLAGPLANLILGGLALGLLAAGLPPAGRSWAGLFASHSLLFGAANLLPLREGRLDSDGAALLRLLVAGTVRRPVPAREW